MRDNIASMVIDIVGMVPVNIFCVGITAIVMVAGTVSVAGIRMVWRTVNMIRGTVDRWPPPASAPSRTVVVMAPHIEMEPAETITQT